jgi:hypothetical protein
MPGFADLDDESYDAHPDVVDPTPRQVSAPASDIRNLRKAAKEGRAAMEARDKAVRELAMYKAGIPNTPQGELFVKAYEGDITDPNVIKAEAIRYGVIQGDGGQQQGQGQQLNQGQQQAPSPVQQMLNGSTAAGQMQSGAGAPPADTQFKADIDALIRDPKTTQADVAAAMQRHLNASGISAWDVIRNQSKEGLLS